VARTVSASGARDGNGPIRDWIITVDASGDRGDAVLGDARSLRDQADADGAAIGMLMMGMWAHAFRGTIDV
jgi:hypothetical protein